MFHRQPVTPIVPAVVVTVTGSGTSGRPPARCTGSEPPPQVHTWDVDPEATFLAWLADPAAPETLWPDAHQPVGLPVSWLLGMLCVSSTPLPAPAARQLGYRRPRTIGDAAIDLLLAVSDPAGPRCASFAAARDYLHDLGRHAYLVDDTSNEARTARRRR